MVFAFDTTNNTAKTGDAANITCYVTKDYGTVTVLADTSATEMDATNAKGYYLFDAAQGETNGDCLMISAKSTTANISVIGAPAVIYTRPATGWLAPTVAARTLDVSATGEAGVDWANVGSPTTSLALTGTTIAVTQKVDVDTIKTNPVVNGGTITFPTTATLASTTNITSATGIDVTKWLGGTIPAVNVTGVPKVDVVDWLGVAPNALRNGRVDAIPNLNSGTAQAGANGSITLAASASATDDIYKGLIITIDSSVGAPQSRLITGYTGSTKMATVSPNWTTNPTSSSTYVLSPHCSTDAVVGAVGSVTAGVTVTTNNDKTGYALTAPYDPAKTAAQAGDAMTLTAAYDAAKVAASATTAAAIKTQTDKLTFTVANQLDANIQYVNDVLVNGVGSSGNPWGP